MAQPGAVNGDVTAVLPVTGYLDRLSVRPGDALRAHVATAEPAACAVKLVRVICADPNPEGPGLTFEDKSDVFAANFEAAPQAIPRGSYALIKNVPGIAADHPTTWTAVVYPTLLRAGQQTVLAQSSGDEAGFALGVGAEGCWASCRSDTIHVGVPMTERRWYRIWATWSPEEQMLTVGQCRLPKFYEPQKVDAATGMLDVASFEGGESVVTIAACFGAPTTQHFNGRIEDPAILSGAVDEETVVGLDPATPPANVIAAWDFSRGIETQTIEDVGPGALNGALINLPMRAVKGAAWDGRTMCWTDAPRDYAAIHFHDDDVCDCGWDVSFTFDVPTTLASGSYAFEISCGDDREYLPFFVSASKDGPHNKIAVLASTFTFQVYANHVRNNADAAYRERVAVWGAYPWNAEDYPGYGASTYNLHSDGTGICYSSRLRPMLTVRPGYLTFNDPKGSGLRHYAADSQLYAWLDAMEHDFDVVTDDDLDEYGVEALSPYKAVLTGSHPEYHTERMLDALQAYVAGGGRLAYLGGNGFYWKIVRTPTLPGVIEIRRAEGGIRAWASEVGEYYHAFDGSYGGLWRRNGRPPQAVAGTGFSAQGPFEGSYFRRLPASYDARFKWLFDGIDDEILGDFGFGGGGAAGYELDRADTKLGTPEDAVILARSEGHAPGYITPPEEILTHLKTVTGERPEDLIRAEMVFFETEGGGAVFAASAITFLGALLVDDCDNNISHLLDNLVRAFGSDVLSGDADAGSPELQPQQRSGSSDAA